MILKKKKNPQHQNKAEFMTLDDFELINGDFLGLKTSKASLTSSAFATSLALTASTALFL
jgi:hypothetical protein